jgi:molybdate transport system regulatory protein
MAALRDVHVRVRIDFDAGTSFGPGKVALLERIDACGSLSQAARDLGLSYRRAWNLLDDLNHAFAEPVVATATGGARGGGARVTAFGQRLIKAYRRVETAAAKAATLKFAALAPGHTASRAGSGAATPRRRLARRLRNA